MVVTTTPECFLWKLVALPESRDQERKSKQVPKSAPQCVKHIKLGSSHLTLAPSVTKYDLSSPRFPV